ncbi:Uncharacterised protein [Streptococcus sanguinis]|uniref:Uncharacterized protein n=1 Tax=Streptococcus sanguinis TaxID=1305 RepID=A0A2X3XHW9_STRSA|nr:Uncharacterised protein [Streptococcus sanguinis]
MENNNPILPIGSVVINQSRLIHTMLVTILD